LERRPSAIFIDQVESMEDLGQKAQLEQQGLQLLDQVNRLQSLQMVACTRHSPWREDALPS
jgi:hypothetical protein